MILVCNLAMLGTQVYLLAAWCRHQEQAKKEVQLAQGYWGWRHINHYLFAIVQMFVSLIVCTQAFYSSTEQTMKDYKVFLNSLIFFTDVFMTTP